MQLKNQLNYKRNKTMENLQIIELEEYYPNKENKEVAILESQGY